MTPDGFLASLAIMDGRPDSHGIRLGTQSDLDNTSFYSNTNIDSNVLKYEYKTDISNLDTYSNIFSIWKTTLTNFL
jgi:hypothetical protein